MDDEVFEDYDRELELALYREYRDVVSQFQYVIETERRFYLANEVNVVRRDTEHDFYFEITMTDVWVGTLPGRSVREVRPRAHVQGRQRRGALPPRLPPARGAFARLLSRCRLCQNSVGEPMNDQDARWCRLIPCSRIASRWSGLA